MNVRLPATVLSVAALALGAAACGDDEEESGSGQAQEQQKQQPKPVAEVPQLTGETTAVKLDPEFVAGLQSLKLTPAPVGDAQIENGSAKFPITGGNVKYFKPGTVRPFVQGRLEHNGSGLSLKGGGTTVRLTDFVIDPGTSMLMGKVTANGKEAAANAPLFFLNGSTLKPLRTTDDGRAVLEGTTVTLTAEAAELLNTTFKVDALKEGFPIGVAKITINT
jgi:hypothetical protein